MCGAVRDVPLLHHRHRDAGLATLKANLIKWIGSSGVAHGADGKTPTKDVKPGNRMHYYKMFNVAGLRETNQTFTAEELDDLAEYLLTLK